jgi:hypothetical protein
MNIEEQNDEIIAQLKMLNSSIHKQNSKVHILSTGVIYGVGFFIGSAIIATIALGILGPIIGKISWVGENFEKGSSILQPR